MNNFRLGIDITFQPCEYFDLGKCPKMFPSEDGTTEQSCMIRYYSNLSNKTEAVMQSKQKTQCCSIIWNLNGESDTLFFTIGEIFEPDAHSFKINLGNKHTYIQITPTKFQYLL